MTTSELEWANRISSMKAVDFLALPIEIRSRCIRIQIEAVVVARRARLVADYEARGIPVPPWWRTNDDR
jgi:hypothetical protein